MAANRLFNHFWRILAVSLAVTALFASEHHGVVKSNGLPVPGATVTASAGDKKLVTTTDENGVYSFPELADGLWTIQIEMLGFSKLSREIGVAGDAASPQWELKFLSMGDIEAQGEAQADAVAAAAKTAAPVTTPGAPTATTPPAAGAATPPPAGAATATAAAKPGAAAPAPAKNSRPSLNQALAAQNGRGGFQRATVNAAANSGAAAAVDQSSSLSDLASIDLNQSASDATIVNGSVSSALGMPQQNDWGFGGRGGMDMGGFGGPGGMDMGGMGGPGGPGGPGGDGGAPAIGGRGGRGGGGPGGGGPGGGGGFGGPGGFGGGPGGGGRGGGGGGQRGAGRGGPGRGGNTAASFGNGRRNRRMQYNGNLSFTLDNSALDAQAYSLTGQNTPKPSQARARGSATFGGPLKIPKLLSGEKGTFNLSYSLSRNRSGNTSSSLVPTQAERGGDFSQALNAQGLPVVIYDPLNGLPFAGNVIPVNRLNSAALGLLNFYPLPNFSGNSRYNYQVPLVSRSNSDNINTRLNQTLNAKNQVSGGVGYQRSSGNNPNLFGFLDGSNGSGVNANAAWIYHFTPRIINNVRYTFSRSTGLSTPFFANRQNVAAQLGILGTDQTALNWGPPSLQFTTFAGLSDGNEALTRSQTSSIGESLIWIRGVHNITVGGDFRRQQYNPISQQNARGQFAFTGGVTSQVVNGVPVTGTGFDLADFLLGKPDTSAIAYGNADKYFRASVFDAYITDDWRINTQLTVNGGFRWDYQVPVTELYNRLVSLDASTGFGKVVPVLAGQAGSASGTAYSNSLLNPDKHNFSPRIGVTWRPSNKHSTTIRGGYGIYYNTSIYQTIASKMAQQSPLSYSVTQANSVLNPLTLQNGFPVPANVPFTNTYGIDPNLKIGYTQNWQVSVQQNLISSMVMTVSYLGIKGTHQIQEFVPNSLPSGATATGLPSNFAYDASGGNSTREAGQIQMQRRFHNGFSGNFTYTYSKAIDDASPGGRGAGGSAIAQNWLDLGAERARSSFDQRHAITAMMQFSTGQGMRAGALLNGWKATLLKDWTITSSVSAGSGLPETVILGGNRSVTGGTGITGSLRPEVVGSLDTSVPGYAFNVNAFAVPIAGTYGNAGRNIIEGPSQFSLNGSAGRVFRLPGERRRLDLRFDSTNYLNHVNFRSWNTTFGGTQFGLPTSANGMRTFNATLRFSF